MNLITIKLREGCSSFTDDSNNIYLSVMNKTETIDTDDCNLDPIIRGIKNGKIYVLEGRIFTKPKYIFNPIFYGIENIKIYTKTKFNPMEGVIVMSDSVNITDLVALKGLVNVNTPGVYTLEYSVSDKAGNKATAQRKITVVDKTAPEIYGVDDLSIEKGTTFDPLAGVSVKDLVDGVIDNTKILLVYKDASNNIVSSIDTNVLGNYTVTYSVSDAASNIATKLRNVTVIEPVDKIAPIFAGVEDKEVAAGEDFDPSVGVTAIDDKDGDVTSSITVSLV